MTFKVAGVQMDVALADKSSNLESMHQLLQQTASNGAFLTVFPECALTGYCFDSLDEAREQAETIPGPSTAMMAEWCRQLQTYAVFGLLEHEGDRIYNACALVGPEGLVGSYRKVHLPFLGVDRFTTPGDRPFAVHAAGDLRIGMHICYDGAFPECCRALALEGADLLVLPTNWPPGAECMSSHVANTRALENQVYYMAVNRIGEERGFRFIGGSLICNPSGQTMDQAAHVEPAILWAEVDPSWARNKHIIRVPNKHEIDRFNDRRPEMYGPLVRQ